MSTYPSYVELCGTGEVEARIKRLRSFLKRCELCPRKCRVNRLKGEVGFCMSGEKIVVSSYFPHFGEERVLVGRGGSGTIFLSHCNLGCTYCQNYEISHLGAGETVERGEVAAMMVELQRRGCHNINLVTPTHFAPQLVEEISIACAMGLTLPIVWNCSGYENVEVIKLLEGIVDIYMPDVKYGGGEEAMKYSSAPDYFERCREAVMEMHRQVGDLEIRSGVARRGLIVRHLVLPNNVARSEDVLRFVASLSKDTYINLMDQYWPAGEAWRYKEINRRVTGSEFKRVVELAKKLGLHRFAE